jgi:putative FmdB family regulatory protein
MPTYEYECQRCGHSFELFQGIKEPPKKRCPKCRGKVNRLLGTGAGVIFKGSGFYSTDYRSESYKAGAKADKTASSSASDSASKGKDSAGKKPAKTGDKKAT